MTSSTFCLVSALGLVEVVVHGVLGIEAVLGGNRGLLGVVDDQELVGAVLGGQLDALRGQGVLNPQLGGVLVLGALEDGGGTNLAGGAGRGDLQADVVVAVVHDLVDAVVQEAQADGALAGADVLGRAGAGLGVDGDVLVEVDEELDAVVVAVLLGSSC